jgi:UDP-N-acetylmuramate--alanine ligase
VQTIGFSPEADWVVAYDPRTREVRLSHERREVAIWRISVPGAHNAFNASVALVLASWLGAQVPRVASSLASFKGVDRRLQLLGERVVSGTDHASGGTGQGVVRVFDDYGHHPTEVDVTLRALREAERPEERGGRLICVWRGCPHNAKQLALTQRNTNQGSQRKCFLTQIGQGPTNAAVCRGLDQNGQSDGHGDEV